MICFTAMVLKIVRAGSTPYCGPYASSAPNTSIMPGMAAPPRMLRLSVKNASGGASAGAPPLLKKRRCRGLTTPTNQKHHII